MDRTTATILKAAIKGGKSYAALSRANEQIKNGELALFVVQNSLDIIDYEADQCMSVGFTKEQIIRVKELKKWKTKDYQKVSNLEGKIVLINKHETYAKDLVMLVESAIQNDIEVTLYIDEYDQNGIGHYDGLKKNNHKYAQIDGVLNTLSNMLPDIHDTLICISATNSSGVICNLNFKVEEVPIWNKDKYKGREDHREVQVSNETMACLLETGEILGQIKVYVEMAKVDRKTLITSTKRVNGDDEAVTHDMIVNSCQRLGKKAIAVNGKNRNNKDSWDSAEVVVMGQLADRTFNARDVYTQIIDYKSSVWAASAAQRERLCGVKNKPYETIIVLSEKSKKIRRASLEIDKKCTKEFIELDSETRIKEIETWDLGVKLNPTNKNNGGKYATNRTKNYKEVEQYPVLKNGKPDIPLLALKIAELTSEFRLPDGTKSGTGLSTRSIRGYGQNATPDIATGKRSEGEVKLRLEANKINDLNMEEGTRVHGLDKYILGDQKSRKAMRENPPPFIIDAQFDEHKLWYTLFKYTPTAGTYLNYVKNNT